MANLEYWETIQYGIEKIGKNIEIEEIEKFFKGRTKVFEDDMDDWVSWSIDHAHVGQEHLCLSFEDDQFYGLMDFDLIPINYSQKSAKKQKKLVNFKTQIFGKKLSIWKNPLKLLKKKTLSNLKGKYGTPNNFSNLSREKEEPLEKLSKLLHEQILKLGYVRDINHWYISINNFASFYHFTGQINKSPYISFAITETFNFNKED